MATAQPVASPSITVDVEKDLNSLSALKNMLTSQGSAIFTIGQELAQYALAPIQKAAAASVSAKVTIGGSANWTLGNGIGFSLAPTASCSISVSPTSETFEVATTIEDSSQTIKVAGATPAGMVYVNIDLDFDITGSVSGSGTVSGVGIAGKASGALNTTLSFCQPVDATLSTLDGIKLAFSELVFPLDPKCAESMQPGALAKVSFDATFNCELDATYGLGDYKVSAPSVAKVQQSLQNVVQIKVPTVTVSAGARGSVTYAHADHFGLIVNKTDSSTAMLYLVRSDENDWGASVGITAGVTATDASVTIDQTALGQAVRGVTGSSTLASAVVTAASQPLNQLQTGLNGKLKSWIGDVTGQVGLSASLSRQHGHTALFTFKVDLTNASLAELSWSALVGGSVQQALTLKGFELQPGSGVADSLKRASTIQFQFFNLFSFKSTSDYFSNAYTEFASDGTIRVFRDIGQEQSVQTKNALAQFRIHFVATASQDALNNISGAAVDLHLELSEKADTKAAVAMINTGSLLPASVAVNAAVTAMSGYFASQPSGTMTLAAVIKPSGYRKLTSTPYNGTKPLPLPHALDQKNWIVFQNATELLDSEIGFVPSLSFAYWINWNRACIDEVGSQIAPDRHQSGNPGAIPPSFFDNVGTPELVNYFLLASSGLMNLCENLQILASALPQVNTDAQWNSVLGLLTNLVTKDVFIDYAKPTAAALLYQATVGGGVIATSVDVAKDASTLTCTLTIS